MLLVDPLSVEEERKLALFLFFFLGLGHVITRVSLLMGRDSGSSKGKSPAFIFLLLTLPTSDANSFAPFFTLGSSRGLCNTVTFYGIFCRF